MMRFWVLRDKLREFWYFHSLDIKAGMIGALLVGVLLWTLHTDWIDQSICQAKGGNLVHKGQCGNFTPLKEKK